MNLVPILALIISISTLPWIQCLADNSIGICKDGQIYKELECYGGLIPGGTCICLNGLWALKHEKAHYSLHFSQGKCFSVGQKDTEISFMGGGGYDETSMIAVEQGVLRETSHYTPEESETTVALFIGRSTSFMVVESTNLNICLILPKSERPKLMSAKLQSEIRSLRVVRECPYSIPTGPTSILKGQLTLENVPHGDALHLPNTETFMLRSVGEGNASTFNCCTSHSKRDKRQAMKGGRSGSGNDPSHQSLFPKTEETEEELQQLANEQTVRIIRKEVLFLLKREVPPKLLNPTWDHLERGVAVFTKACPEVETPSFLVNSLTRVFRTLYLSTSDPNADRRISVINAQNLRIAEALDACLKDAGPFEFTYTQVKVNDSCTLRNITVDAEVVDGGGNGSDAGGSGGNGAQGPTTPSPGGGGGGKMVEAMFCKCQDGIDVVYLNRTKNGVEETINVTKFDLVTPEDYEFQIGNGTLRDLPTEMIWKVTTFVHYYCARYFSKIPADHSAMESAFLHLFNREIQFRWDHPIVGENNPWSTLYSTFNLQKFAAGVDMCVAAAKSASDYPRWIERPSHETLIDPGMRNKREVQNPDEIKCFDGPMNNQVDP